MFEVPGIDDKYRELIPRLYTAVLCDVMDRMGLWNQIIVVSPQASKKGFGSGKGFPAKASGSTQGFR